MIRQSLPALAALLWTGAACAQPRQATLTWSELAPRIAGKKVEFVLPGGTRVRGKVRGVDPSGLLLDISKTSNRKAQPKGVHSVPRESLSVLRLTEYGWIGRLAFTAGALAAAGTLLALGVRDSGITEGTAIIVLPIAGAVGTAGVGIGAYYLGKAVDKRVTEIRIVRQ